MGPRQSWGSGPSLGGGQEPVCKTGLLGRLPPKCSHRMFPGGGRNAEKAGQDLGFGRGVTQCLPRVCDFCLLVLI